MNKCDYCGTRLNFNDTKCPSCGANVNTNYTNIINETLNKDKDNYNLHFVVCLLIIVSSIILLIPIISGLDFDRSWNNSIDSSIFFESSFQRRPIELLSTLATIYFIYRLIILIAVIVLRIKKVHFNLAFALVITFTVSIIAGGVSLIDYSRNEDHFLKI